MANNSDGGIVLSVSIDGSEVSSDMQKVVKEINKQVQAEAKNLKAVESVNQAKEKTSQQQSKTNQEIYKEIEAETKALTAEQNLATAKEKNAIVSAKKTVEEEKGYQALIKSEIAENNLQKSANEVLGSEYKVTQEKEKANQAITQSAISQQTLNQEINNSISAEEKKKQAILNTQRAQQEILIGEQKLKKATEEAAIAQEEHKQAIINTKKAQKSLKNATNSVTTAFKQMVSALGIAYSLGQLVSFTKQASELASQTESYLTRLGMLYGENAQSVYDWANANASAFGMSKAAAYEAAASFGNLFTTFADSSTSAELTKDMLQATAVIASQTGRTYEETFEKIQSGLYGNTRAIDDLGISVRQASLEQTKAYQTVTKGEKSWNDLTDAELQQIRALAIVEQANVKYGDSVLQTSALTRAQFNAAFEDFKSTWGTVINEVLMPVLETLTKITRAATTGLSYVVAFLGKTGTNVQDSEASSSEFAENIESAAENQKKYNKELKTTAAGFDELNIIDTSTGTGTGTDEYEDEGTDQLPKSASVSFDVPKVSQQFKELMAIVGGIIGISLIAIGVLLCFFGHWTFGLGCIIAGVVILGVVAVGVLQGDFEQDQIKTILGDLAAFAGGMLLAIGIFLCFMSCYPVGVACIIAGVLLLGYSIYKTATAGTDDIEKWVTMIMFIAGGALLALGILLLAFGGVKTKLLGVALIAAGAVVLVTAIANQGLVSEEVKKWIDLIFAIVSAALLVIGILMIAFGHVTPLSLGLTIGGAAGLAAEVALNFGAIKEKVKEIINKIKDFVQKYGLLFLGVVLCMTGAGIPIGIGILVKWCKDNYGKIDLATKIVDKAKEIFSKIKSLFKTFLNFLISKAEDALNFLTDGVRKLWDGIAWLLEGAADLLGFDIQIGRIPKIELPRLAQGAVIPANREFLAVLGDQKKGLNIETPLDTMIDAFKTALSGEDYAGGETVVHFTIDLDGDTIYKGVKKAESRRSGFKVNNHAFLR